MRNCLLVLGMHRSGTSALAGVLAKLGAYPGSSLMPAHEDINPKGFWEHEEIVRLHDDLLAMLDAAWDDECPLADRWWANPAVVPVREELIALLKRDFCDQPLWVVKDPRLCHLLPLWRDIFNEVACTPSYVHVLRDPGEVAKSLNRRDRMPVEKACLLWASSMLDAEYQTRAGHRVFVKYRDLLTDWRSTVADIAEKLSLYWPNAPREATQPIDEFLTPGLRHYREGEPLPDHPATHLARAAFHELAGSVSPSELDRLRTEVDKLTRLVCPWGRPLAQLNADRSRLESDNVALVSEMARIKRSVSWRITAPLRGVWNALRMLKEKK